MQIDTKRICIHTKQTKKGKFWGWKVRVSIQSLANDSVFILNMITKTMCDH